MARLRPKIARLLAHVDGCQEWGVRIGFDEANAIAKVAEKTPRLKME